MALVKIIAVKIIAKGHSWFTDALPTAHCNKFEIVCRLSYINNESSSFHKSAEDRNHYPPT